MSQSFCVVWWAIAGILFLTTVPSAAAGVQRYDIEPGGQYVYFPSPEGTGIPDCDPSDFECAFEIEGSFSVMTDAGEGTATLFDLDLTLIGNEDIQNSAPTTLVTVEGVTEFLQERLFRDLMVAGPFTIFADETYPELNLTDLLNGTVTLTGGYDFTPADGDGVHFDLSGVAVPEPSSVVLMAVGIVIATAGRRAGGRYIGMTPNDSAGRKCDRIPPSLFTQVR